MAYPDELLVPGEEIIMHRHPHWKMLVGPVVLLLVVVGLGSYLAAVIGAQSWGLWARIALLVIAVGLVVRFTVAPLIRWRTTHFIVTTDRLITREGVFKRVGIDIPMSRINSVQFRHTLLERILGCGTLIIESASDEPLEFDDIPDVERVHSLLYAEAADED